MLLDSSLIVIIYILIISLYIIRVLSYWILLPREIELFNLLFEVIFCFILQVFMFFISIPIAMMGLLAIFKDFVFQVMDLLSFILL